MGSVFTSMINGVTTSKYKKVCTPDIEMLSLSLHPLYLPWKFPTLVFTFVYIPPSANSRNAAESAACNANAMSTKYQDAPLFILGDFNTCRVEDVLTSCQQFVEAPTTRDSVLVLCYGNVNAHTMQC